MRAVDTNVLVRLITREDPRQTASAERFIARGAWVLALAELMCVLGTVGVALEVISSKAGRWAFQIVL